MIPNHPKIMTLEHLTKMRKCRHLPEAPAPDVVEELAVEIIRLRDALQRIAAQRGNPFESTVRVICDMADAALDSENVRPLASAAKSPTNSDHGK